MTCQIDAQGARTIDCAEGLHRIVMTVDAVGGIWRYALDLAKSLERSGVRVALVGFGPRPSQAQLCEARSARLPLTWRDIPLDWMNGGIAALKQAHCVIGHVASAFRADVIQVNSLAYAGPDLPCPVVAVAHSCLPTWWRAVHGGELPAHWRIVRAANLEGMQAAKSVLAPSMSHAEHLEAEYGGRFAIGVVHNASSAMPAAPRRREPFVLAAGRWWDEGKNARVLDEAARLTSWPVVLAGPLRDPAGAGQSMRHARPIGQLDADATRDWMQRAAVFAAPSLYEPFGLAVLEAARASAPLVLADIPTFRELWDGAALFAPPRDPNRFAKTFDALLTNAPLRHWLTVRARARAARFTLERQTAAMLSVYDAALSVEGEVKAKRAV